MKKILFVMAGLALLTSCQDETLQRVESNAAISFENAFVAKTTRAAVDPSTTLDGDNALEGFNVYGFMDQPSGAIFSGDEVSRNGNEWTYVNTQYWLAGHDYYFAALAPMNSTNRSLNSDNANTYGVGTVTFTNVNGTEDLLYAAATATTKGENVSLGAMRPVELAFNHLLSKVKFTFNNGFSNPNTTVEVTGITMTAPAGGSINLAQQDWWTDNEWVLTADPDVTLAFGDVVEGGDKKVPAGKGWESADERLTIPAGQDKEYTITFNVQMYQGGVAAFVDANGAPAPKAHTVVLSGKAFEIGRAYNLVTTLDANNIDPASELYPIVFDVVEVKVWDETPEDVVIGQNVENSAELVAAVNAGGTVVLESDITLAEGTESLDLLDGSVFDGNGHTLTVPATLSDNAFLYPAGMVTIKNVTLDGNNQKWGEKGLRCVYITAAGEYVLDNVKLINNTYAINVSTTKDVTLIVKNSTLEGWTSYGTTTTASFENVKFEVGPSQQTYRPYGYTVLTGCEFEDGFVIDLSELKEPILFENCTYNGVALTKEKLSNVPEGAQVTIK